MILAQARQGASVTYNVEPSTEALFLTAYKMAFCSACSASEQLPLLSRLHPVSGNSSSQLWVPAGGPLYPIEIMRVSLVRTAPTCFLIQWDLLARFTASSIKISSKSGLLIFFLRSSKVKKIGRK